MATLEATRVLVGEGFQVLCYTSDDPIMARRLKEAGAASVMPAGSPIGSGQGVLNPNNIRIILEDLKRDDPTYPVIVDAGVGTASDVSVAMELGCDGVLLNTGIAGARDPLRMAHAMRLAVEAGYLAARAGRIPRKLYATASSPVEGVIGRAYARRDDATHPSSTEWRKSNRSPSSAPTAPSRAGCPATNRAPSRSAWPRRSPRRSRRRRT